MTKQPKPFKSPPKRFHPKGMTILYEDHDILVIDKHSGLLAVSNDKETTRTAFFLLNNYVRKGNQKSPHRAYIVHRLDRETSGVMVFAKTPAVKQFLQESWETTVKTYHTIVHGAPPEPEGEITSRLMENSALRMYSTDDPNKGKLSTTRYKTLRSTKKYTLLEVEIETGRKNQIRVHLSEAGCPIAGDRKYGERAKGIRRLMLHATQLDITHPFTKQPMTFRAEVPAAFHSLMNS